MYSLIVWLLGRAPSARTRAIAWVGMLGLSCWHGSSNSSQHSVCFSVPFLSFFRLSCQWFRRTVLHVLQHLRYHEHTLVCTYTCTCSCPVFVFIVRRPLLFFVQERHRVKQLLAAQELLYPKLFQSLLSAMKPLLSRRQAADDSNPRDLLLSAAGDELDDEIWFVILCCDRMERGFVDWYGKCWNTVITGC